MTEQAPEIVSYKKTPQGELALHVFMPGQTASGAAIVFFFGGGWSMGNVEQFYPHSRALADQGMACFCADYRVSSRHETTPFECVADAQSAVTWVVDHARDFAIDPTKVVASGGSAGGHMAACTALSPAVEVGAKIHRPSALALFNPVVDFMGVGRQIAGMVVENRTDPDEPSAEICPLTQIQRHPPANVSALPTLIFHGEADELVPIAGSERFSAALLQQGGTALLERYPGAGHGFFNFGIGDNSAYHSTLATTIKFLAELNYLR